MTRSVDCGVVGCDVEMLLWFVVIVVFVIDVVVRRCWVVGVPTPLELVQVERRLDVLLALLVRMTRVDLW